LCVAHKARAVPRYNAKTPETQKPAIIGGLLRNFRHYQPWRPCIMRDAKHRRLEWPVGLGAFCEFAFRLAQHIAAAPDGLDVVGATGSICELLA
jgi:hypothetical protein